jgi:sulfate permease, SulP family
MANVEPAAFRGKPVSTGLSASSLNEFAGAQTAVAALATGAVVIATLIVLAPGSSRLPKVVRGAAIIDVVVFGMTAAA